jgi:hypothetical protein
MGIMAEQVLKFVDIKGYEKIRDHLILVISRTYPSIEEDLDMTRYEIKQKAISAAHNADEVDPHENVFKISSSIGELYRKLRKIFFVSVILSVAGVYAAGTLRSLLSYVFMTLSGIPIIFVATCVVYLELLKADTWITQQITKELKISPEKVREKNGKQELFNCWIWNSLLNENHAIPAIASLRIMSMLFQNMYRKCVEQSVVMAPLGVNKYKQKKSKKEFILDIYTEIREFRERWR